MLKLQVSDMSSCTIHTGALQVFHFHQKMKVAISYISLLIFIGNGMEDKSAKYFFLITDI